MLGCSPGKIDKMLVKIKNISANNGVSANNDGINDYLEFKGLPENSRLKVFDKWGRLVYETPSGSYYDNSWNGDNLPAGVYYYVLTYRLGNQHGWVEIFK
jgi:gliding motility-associated-like protein